jgi:hypothetical protein
MRGYLSSNGATMTIIKLSGGDLGSKQLLVRGDLWVSSAPIEMMNGHGWQPTPHRSADVGQTGEGLAALGKQLAARAYSIPADGFDCRVEEL